MKQQLPIALLASMLLQGCANYGQEKHMQGGSFKTALPPIVQAPGRLTLVVMREEPLISKVSYLPWDAFPLALNGKMVSLMPVGSSIVLSLEPGAHELLWSIKGLGALVGEPKKVNVSGPADETRYYILEHNFMEPALIRVPEDRGRTAYAATAPARLIANGAPWVTYKQRIDDANRSKAWDAFKAAMPSGESLQSALEAIGSIALVGLEVAAAVSAEAPSTQPRVGQALQPTSHRPATNTLRMDTLTSTPRTSIAYGSSGVGEVLRSGSETRVRDYRTGTVYTIQDGTVKGSDGTRFKVVGNMLYSDTGASYQIIGDSLLASDGRTCRRVVNTVHCN